ncbi:Nicotinamidase-related amidase [Desulfacinum hydrothermale DSM 13146]|uniref:Nicotinamidase-related amidase n=1 Tax=Desulfacinum hydrothermale DSM 13146 TaxID=1121390 RepID=A0A1W1WZV4_9BACT|nr:isochorismatase family protein [Desulfacinum hydrothermale]SMC17184.1 Nicotinamidase-related amidase [Desulfacinum hydrothermale DSM 13146]
MTADNAHARFIRPEECLLFLVDLQKAMLDLCPDRDQVVKNVMALLDMSAIVEVPVLFSEHNAEKLGGFLPELVAKVPEPKVLNKLEFSCFQNPALADAVAASGRNTLVIAGIEAHVCIFHTAAHALRLGYTVHVVGDAVTSRSAFNRETGLRRLDRAGAVITSTEMVTFEWLNRAGTPQFRRALPILKSF